MNSDNEGFRLQRRIYGNHGLKQMAKPENHENIGGADQFNKNRAL
jgi:hypothetical protein